MYWSSWGGREIGNNMTTGKMQLRQCIYWQECLYTFQSSLTTGGWSANRRTLKRPSNQEQVGGVGRWHADMSPGSSLIWRRSQLPRLTFYDKHITHINNSRNFYKNLMKFTCIFYVRTWASIWVWMAQTPFFQILLLNQYYMKLLWNKVKLYPVGIELRPHWPLVTSRHPNLFTRETSIPVSFDRKCSQVEPGTMLRLSLGNILYQPFQGKQSWDNFQL